MTAALAACADVGSTFTKAFLVDLGRAEVVATAEHPTTAGTDVLRGLDAAIAAARAAAGPGVIARTDACSSAGGGLRLAVVGYERLVTAEAGQRVGLTAGARVVHVAAGRLDGAGLAALRSDRPDVVLLVGGTDGGDEDVLRHNADRLAMARLRIPVVVAGNAQARDGVLAALLARGVPAVATENVLPRIGVLNPDPARSAIRDVFLGHVIGGKRLSRGPRFRSLVRGPTPDIVLTAVEVLADRIAADLMVVDIGGATTDVYSVRRPDADTAGSASDEVAGTLWHGRTVEGDLGVRAGAPGIVAAAVAERLLTPDAADALAEPARRRSAEPEFLPQTDTDQRVDARLAELAAVIAVRRHARGRDLSRVRLVVGSGGVLRHAADAESILAPVLTDTAGGWRVPDSAAIVVDRCYLLAPAGLLALSGDAQVASHILGSLAARRVG